jgi:hypothetical protein
VYVQRAEARREVGLSNRRDGLLTEEEHLVFDQQLIQTTHGGGRKFLREIQALDLGAQRAAEPCYTNAQESPWDIDGLRILDSLDGECVGVTVSLPGAPSAH